MNYSINLNTEPKLKYKLTDSVGSILSLMHVYLGKS